MKTLLQSFPPWLKSLIFFFILVIATFIAGVFPPVNDFVFFLIISVLTSWLLLWSEGQSLASLGLTPLQRQDWSCFLGGIVAGVLMLIVTVIVTLFLTKDNWSINKHIDLIYVLISLLICLWSAFVQEFIFRGYPFQTLLKHYGTWVAQLSVAIPFGLMHINSTMDLQTLATVMLTTGLGSIFFGLAYIKTGKLWLPIGLHMGWNYAQQLVPRTPGDGDKGFLIVTGNPVGHHPFFILGPYLVVMALAIILLSFKTNKENEYPKVTQC